MSRVWLANSRGVKLFVEFGNNQINFGYVNTGEKDGPYDSYIINFTVEQWAEITELWNAYARGETLPDNAGHLKK